MNQKQTYRNKKEREWEVGKRKGKDWESEQRINREKKEKEGKEIILFCLTFFFFK